MSRDRSHPTDMTSEKTITRPGSSDVTLSFDSSVLYNYYKSLDPLDFSKQQEILKKELQVTLGLNDEKRTLLASFTPDSRKNTKQIKTKSDHIRNILNRIKNQIDRNKEDKIPEKMKNWIFYLLNPNGKKPVEPNQSETEQKSSGFKIHVPKAGEDGKISLTNEFGVHSQWQMTPNQQAFVNSVLNPDNKAVFLEAPVGAGKTLWVVWAALTLLEQGKINRIYYDRPLKTVAGQELGFLPGDIQKKTGPYHAVLREKFAEVLGKGNIKSGMKVLEALEKEGLVERYDEALKRGHTVYGSLLLIDEAQNKLESEIYHLITRPDGNSKVILVGDSEMQIDTGQESGLQQGFEIYEGVPGAAFHRFNEDDIKRSEFAKAVYMARKKWLAKKKENAQAASTSSHLKGNENGNGHHRLTSLLNHVGANGNGKAHHNGNGYHHDDFGDDILDDEPGLHP